MFYAATNKAVVGYVIHAVAFESKRKRDLFCAATGYEAIPAKVARSLEQYDMMRNYPDSILDARGYVQGDAMFTYGGEFAGIW